MAQKTVVIKKYENRRLYDTTNSRYVNLDEVAQLLQRGDHVQVFDAGSGEDITRLILTQIIVEDAKTAESTFPLDLLRQMVIATGQAGQESTLQYMKMMLEIYQNAFRAIPNPLNPFDFMQNGRPAQEKQNEGSSANSGPNSSEDRTPDVKRPDSDSEGVEDLKGRIAELEKLVSTIVGPTKAAKGKR